MDTDSIIKLLKEQGQIILQGAPGTGKTYATVELAVALCCPNEYQSLQSNHDSLKKKYDELVKEGRVAFTTFHQSMDYEDFVEGYKPTTKEERENGEGDFKRRDGIFKKICKDAALGLENAAAKDKLIEELKKEASVHNGVKITDANDKEYQLFFNGQWFYECDESYSKKTMATRWNTYKQNKSLKSDTIAKSICIYLESKYTNIDFSEAWNRLCNEITTTGTIEVNTGNNSRQTYQLKNVENDSILVHRSCDIKNIEDSSESSNGYQNAIYRRLEEFNKKNRANYLLIIDEINRANISKVMGELITLLEKGKRKGNEDARSAKLPYSQEEFTVPDNLYIIGTMNTADRSLGSIDYAIRRRFAFVTLEAEENHVGNKYKDSFNKVKKLIEECRDDDFEVDEIMAGHSYFMPKDDDEWQRNIDYKIIPLLLEYFKDGVLIDKKNIFTDRKMTKKDQLKSYLSNKNQKNVPEGEIEDQQQSKQQTAPE